MWEVTAGGLSRSVTAVGDWSSAEDDRHVVETRLRLKGVTSVWRGLGPDEGRIALALIENPAIGPLVRKGLGSVERVTLLDR